VVGKGEAGRERLVESVLRRVEKELEHEEEAAGLRGAPGLAKTGWRATLGRLRDTFTQLVVVGGNRRALLMACMLQGFQQLCGFVRSPILQLTPLANFTLRMLICHRTP